MNELTIIMYHYVRPIKGSEYPGIKGLEIDGFKRQLDYLAQTYNVISTDQVICAATGSSHLPDNPCWLTFDDGYKDHFKHVLPELLGRNLHGAFFPPRVAIEEDVLLDVNAIHHILSCSFDVKHVVARLKSHCITDGISENSFDRYFEKYAVPTRFDNADTVFVKRMLQHVLPEQLRSFICDSLFQEFVGVSASEFSTELYMTVDEVKELVNCGMYVGSHGSSHCWLNKVSPEEQDKDIKCSLNFLEEIGAATTDWVMCYPYGAHDDATLAVLNKYGASVGITTEARVADLKADNPFALPRLNTNDFPQ